MIKSSNLVFSPDDSEGRYATFPSVLIHNGLYYLFYLSDVESKHVISLATSVDGKNWVKLGIVFQDEYHNIGVCKVWIENGIWIMLYRKIFYKYTVETHIAFSNDGKHWIKGSHNPIITPKLISYTKHIAETTGVIKVDNTYYVWVWGKNFIHGKTLGLISTQHLPWDWDQDCWTEHSKNPIFKKRKAHCPDIFRYGNNFYMLVCEANKGYESGTIELYQCPNVFFQEEDRKYLGTVIDTKDESWCDWHPDVPHVLTDNIYRNSFKLNQGRIWMFYSGAYSHTGIWSTGMKELIINESC